MADFKSLMRDYSRLMLVVFNFFFVLTGVIIISVGVSAKAYYNEFDDLLNEKYFYISDLLIIVGAIIFIIAIFGCSGAAKENACLTTTFSTLLIIIFILELLVGIGGILLRHKTEELLKEKLDETLSRYGQNKTKELTETWDAVQQQMHCCGVTNFTDWYNVTRTSSLPISCCYMPPGTTGTFSCNSNTTTLYQKGCLQKFGDYIKNNTSSIEIAGLTLAAVQLIAIFLACYLAKQIRSDYETV